MTEKKNGKQGKADKPNGADGAEGYEVGKGKPPIAHQFQNGNKFGKGRPPGSKNMATIVNKIADTKVPVKADGKEQKLPKKEVVVMKVANQAMAGNQKSQDQFIALVERYEPRDMGEDPTPEEHQADIDSLRDYLDHHDMLNGDGEDDND